MAGLAGKNGTMKIGAADYPITSWNASLSVELLDDSNSKSSGREERVTGFSIATGTVEGYLDNATSSDNPITAAKPGTAVSLLLYVDAANFLTIPAVIGNMTFNVDVKGKVTYTMAFESSAYDMDTNILVIAS